MIADGDGVVRRSTEPSTLNEHRVPQVCRRCSLHILCFCSAPGSLSSCVRAFQVLEILRDGSSSTGEGQGGVTVQVLLAPSGLSALQTPDAAVPQQSSSEQREQELAQAAAQAAELAASKDGAGL
jgi:hypothetical protein